MSLSDVPVAPVIEKGTYRNYKDLLYEVIGVASHSETLEPLVIYKPLYRSSSEYWVRPYAMFIETVEVNGKTMPRFEKVED